MKQKVCVSKKTVFIGLFVLVLFGAIFTSQYLTQTKTSLNSRASNNKGVTAVIGGNDAKEGRWPFMVAVKTTYTDKTIRWCGGVLVAPGWVYTAGHCVVNKNSVSFSKIKSVYVYAGSNNKSSATPYELFNTQILSRSIFLHPKLEIIKSRGTGIYGLSFSKDQYYARYDAALLKLKDIPQDSVTKSPLQTISLATDLTTEQEGKPGVILGWGQAESGEYTPEKLSSQLKEAIIPILASNRDVYKVLNTKDNAEVLGGFPQGDANICLGDSGGPLLVWNQTKWVLVGTTSYAVGECGANGYYAGFGRSLFYSDWITKTIQSDGLLSYNRIGTFKGSNLEQPQLESFNLRLCETEVWSGNKPNICTSVGRDEILVWKPIYNKTNKSIIDSFAPVLSVERDVQLTPNVNFDAKRGDKAYLAKNTPYYVCMKHTSYSIKDKATIYWYARKEIIDNVSTNSVTPHPTSANDGTAIIPDFSAMQSTENSATDFELRMQMDINKEFPEYNLKKHGIGCTKISFTYMTDRAHPVVLGGDYYSYDGIRRLVVDPDGNKETKDSSRFVAKPLEIGEL